MPAVLSELAQHEQVTQRSGIKPGGCQRLGMIDYATFDLPTPRIDALPESLQ